MTAESATVLVVDDEPTIREFLTDVLTDAGYAVRTAPHGRAALTHVEADPPDVVLSDVFMPELDGWSLAAELRRRFPAVQVVMMSAYRPDFPVSKMRFIAKPFDLDALLNLVEDAMGTGEHT
jgi:two-component system response regulator AtoC